MKSTTQRLFIIYFIVFTCIVTGVVQKSAFSQNIKEQSFKEIGNFSGIPYFIESTGSYFIVAGAYNGKYFKYHLSNEGEGSNLTSSQLSFDDPNCQANIAITINDMKPLSGGGFILVGSGKSSCNDNHFVIAVFKVYSNGVFADGNFFYIPDRDLKGFSVFETSNNKYIITGTYAYFDANQKFYEDILFLKINANLQFMNARHYRLNSYEKNIGRFIFEPTSKIYIIIGGTGEDQNSISLPAFLKLDSVGNLLDKGFYNPASININRLQKNYNAGFGIVGGISDGSSIKDIAIGSINSSASITSSHSYGYEEKSIEDEDAYDEGFSMIKTVDSNYLIAGSSTSRGYNNNFHTCFVQVDNSFNLVKSLVFGVKCQGYTNMLCLKSFGYDISCKSDSSKYAVMTGVLLNDNRYNFVINPGIGLNLNNNDDLFYYWCSAVDAGFGEKGIDVSKNNNAIITSTSLTLIGMDMSMQNTSLEMILCNMCGADCIPKAGKIKAKNKCNCDMLLKKYDE